MPADAYLRGHAVPSLAAVSSAREVAPAAPRRLRGPAARVRARRVGGPRPPRRRRSPRPRPARAAQAQRLAYGAVQRRGTSDHLIAELAERPLTRARSARPRRAAPGPLELLFSEATPGPRRGGPGGRAGEGRRAAGAGAPARGLVNAVLRRAAAARRPARGPATTTTPEGAAAAPLLSRAGSPGCGGTELGPHERTLTDGGDERARRDRASRQHAEGRARSASSRSSGDRRAVVAPRAPGSCGRRRRSSSRAR